MTVDLFSPLTDDYQQHLIFRQLCGPRQAAERDVLRDWARGFVDRDGKFVKEFPDHFRVVNVGAVRACVHPGTRRRRRLQARPP